MSIINSIVCAGFSYVGTVTVHVQLGQMSKFKWLRLSVRRGAVSQKSGGRIYQLCTATLYLQLRITEHLTFY